MSKQELFMQDDHSVRRRIRTFKLLFKTLEIIFMVAKVIDLIDEFFKK